VDDFIIDLDELDDYPEIDLSDYDFTDIIEEFNYMENPNGGYCFDCYRNQLIHGANYRIPRGKYQGTLFGELVDHDFSHIFGIIARPHTSLHNDIRKCLSIYTEENPQILNDYITDFGKGRNLHISDLYSTRRSYFDDLLKKIIAEKSTDKKRVRFKFIALWYINWRRTGSYQFGYL
jgi:hypothetical protein